MSKARPDLPSSKKAAKDYVKWLANLGCFDRILLCGSRSPLRGKKPKKGSDWDFALVSEIEKLNIVYPRESGQLHADVTIITPANIDKLTAKWVEVWPDDKMGVFT